MFSLPFTKSPIARRFILYIVLFSSLITLIITASQLYRDYNNDISLIEYELARIETVHKESISAALWASNSKLLQTTIEGILQNRDIQYIEIRDKDKIWAQAGEINGLTEKNIERNYIMTYRHRNKDINIGMLTVNVSLNGVYQRLYDKVFLILVSNAIKTALVALFISFLFYRFVVRHLSTIVKFLQEHKPLSNIKPLQLTRSNKKKDEFDDVVDSINDMHKRLNEQVVEIKDSHALLEKITARVPGMVYQFLLNPDGSMSFPYVSEAVQELYDLSAEEVLGDANRIFSQTHPDDVAKLNDSIMASARNFTPWKLEYRIYKENGAVRWLYGDSKPERLPDGGLLWHGFVTDITEKKETEDALKRTQKMDALGKLTGGIAHDYNNMLGVILGYCELLNLEVKEQPELFDYVEQITRAGERGVKLTKRILSFSRNKVSDFERLDINTVLRDELHMLEKTLTARIKLELKLEDNLWSVHVDESELEDAILNICINAMHAISNNGSIVIETSNIKLDFNKAEKLGLEVGDYVQLKLSDSGCGIDSSIKDKIFDPFYTTKGDKGTGLGLSQVYGFMNRSSGAVSVESELDKGSEFVLYFPRYLGEDNKIEFAELDENLESNNQEKILVVDDEPSLLTLACEILEKQGYQTFVAENALMALDMLEKEHIDLLLSDVVMPDMDGYELACIVQEKYPEVKIQLVSGYTGIDNNKNVDRKLFDSLLNKPYKSDDLLSRIRVLLQ